MSKKSAEMAEAVLKTTFTDGNGRRRANGVMVPLPLLRKLQAAIKSK